MKSLEIFSCLGGMALGFRRAGVNFELAVDMDPNACDSYEANLGHRPLEVNARKLLRHKASRGPWDFVVADPPCTPWSRAGKRKGLKDQRDMLRATIGILDVLRPTCWLIGNIPGLDDSNNWETVVKPVLGAWAWRSGYCVDYGKFNCADYGVPQVRKRPFWFGHLKGSSCIRWPQPTHAKPNGTMRLDGLPPWVTCRDALGHLPVSEMGRRVMLRSHRGRPNKGGSVSGELELPRNPKTMDEPYGVVIATWSGGKQGANILIADPRHNSHVDRPANVVTTKEARREHVLVLNPRHPICEPGIPARTVCARDQGGQASSVTKDQRIAPPGHHAAGSYMSEGIVLSEKARLILQGFPEDWIVCGKTKKSRDSQIGQAMPPPMAMHVTESIVRWFDRR